MLEQMPTNNSMGRERGTDRILMTTARIFKPLQSSDSQANVWPVSKTPASQKDAGFFEKTGYWPKTTSKEVHQKLWRIPTARVKIDTPTPTGIG